MGVSFIAITKRHGYHSVPNNTLTGVEDGFVTVDPSHDSQLFPHHDRNRPLCLFQRQ